MVVLIAVCACKSNNSEATYLDDEYAWKKWLEEGVAGVSANDGPFYVLNDTILNIATMDNAGIGIISDFAVSNGKIAIADNIASKIHLFTLDGHHLWSSGESGEGPGCFAHIGGIDMNAGVVAVCNTDLGRVDLFGIGNGEYLESLPVQWPFDVTVLDDTTVLAASIAEAALITAFSSDGSIEKYGEWDPEETDGMVECPSASNINLKIDSFNSYVAVTSVYYNNYQIYDTATQEIVSEFQREPPLPIEQSSESRYILRVNDCTFDDNGDVWALLAPTRPEWVDGRYSDIPLENISYQGIDVFSAQGRYLCGIGVEALWDTSNLTFCDSVLYLGSPTAICRFREVSYSSE